MCLWRILWLMFFFAATSHDVVIRRPYWRAKFHKVGRYDQLRCKTFYNELCCNNITSSLGVTPGLSLIANLPPTMKLFLYERHQIFLLTVWMFSAMYRQRVFLPYNFFLTMYIINVWCTHYPFLLYHCHLLLIPYDIRDAFPNRLFGSCQKRASGKV